MRGDTEYLTTWFGHSIHGSWVRRLIPHANGKGDIGVDA